MTPQEIDALIERAGLRGILCVFDSAIEIDRKRGDSGYTALAALLSFYGDERARAERERAAQVAAQQPYLRDAGPYEERGASFMRDSIVAAIAALD